MCVSGDRGNILQPLPLPPGDHLLSIVIPYKAAEEHDLQRRREITNLQCVSFPLHDGPSLLELLDTFISDLGTEKSAH